MEDQTPFESADVYKELPQAALISLVHSITRDEFVEPTSPELIAELELLRQRSTDGTKVIARSIEKTTTGYQIVLDDGTPLILHDNIRHKNSVFGGGLANLGRDLGIIMRALDGNPNANGEQPTELPLKFLTLSETAAEFPGAQTIPGSPRTSLVFECAGMSKLIITERGPQIGAGINTQHTEREFIGDNTNAIFVGQEPNSSEKFKQLITLKQQKPNAKIFWLVGSNQLKEGVEKYRDFLSVVDVVSLNLAEATKFLGLPELRPEHDRASEIREKYAREISRQFAELGVKNIIITDGARGANLARSNPDHTVSFIHAPLRPAKRDAENGIAEDTGCGDGFAAGIAAYFLRHTDYDIQKAADFAHRIAAKIYHKKETCLADKDASDIRREWREAETESRFTDMRMCHFPTNEFQITVERAQATRAGARKHLVLLLGTPISGRVVGTDALIAGMHGGDYTRLKPYVHIIPEHTDKSPKPNHDTTVALGLTERGLPNDQQRFRYRDTASMRKSIERGEFHPTLLTQPEGGHGGHLGVLRSDLTRPDGIDIVHAGFLEALEILTRKDIMDLYGGNVEIWHFGATPDTLATRLETFEQAGIVLSTERGNVQGKIRSDQVRGKIAGHQFATNATDPQIVAKKTADQMARRLDDIIRRMQTT